MIVRNKGGEFQIRSGPVLLDFLRGEMGGREAAGTTQYTDTPIPVTQA